MATSWGSVFGPPKYTDQTPKLRRYDWLPRDMQIIPLIFVPFYNNSSFANMFKHQKWSLKIFQKKKPSSQNSPSSQSSPEISLSLEFQRSKTEDPELTTFGASKLIIQFHGMGDPLVSSPFLGNSSPTSVFANGLVHLQLVHLQLDPLSGLRSIPNQLVICSAFGTEKTWHSFLIRSSLSNTRQISRSNIFRSFYDTDTQHSATSRRRQTSGFHRAGKKNTSTERHALFYKQPESNCLAMDAIKIFYLVFRPAPKQKTLFISQDFRCPGIYDIFLASENWYSPKSSGNASL